MTRARYTLEFKLEAVRLVKAGQSVAAAPTPLRCHCCGGPLPQLVRTGFVRRRGSRRAYPEGEPFGRRIDRGDPDDDSG
ncbi:MULTISPECIES: hypothetical protein [Burkholderia]|uniref:hypothetical protein n=1 Tax=Burkholderia TaxID=32008 RepID=UPI0009FACE6F|nr:MULTISPECIES: hypothetical protein [Burkholderia]